MNSLEIAQEIAKGIHKKQYLIVETREDAIITAIDLLNSKDTLLILGKNTQYVKINLLFF